MFDIHTQKTLFMNPAKIKVGTTLIRIKEGEYPSKSANLFLESSLLLNEKEKKD